MRIVGGAWRGRRLTAPSGLHIRPTADRMRQALFDMLLHAPWGGRAVLDGAHVLDIFAGTGALGLEALSRGAASCCFIENDPIALKALLANVSACGAGSRATQVVGDATQSDAKVSSTRTGVGGINRAGIVFLDPPYGRGLVPLALAAQAPRIAPGALIVVETSREEEWLPTEEVLADRTHGAARVVIFRNSGPG